MAQLEDNTDAALREFGTDAVYTNAAGVLTPIRVVFSPESYVEGQVGSAAAVSRVTLASARSTDVPGADNRCTLKVAGVTYNVVEGKAYGDGWTILTLSLD